MKFQGFTFAEIIGHIEGIENGTADRYGTQWEVILMAVSLAGLQSEFESACFDSTSEVVQWIDSKLASRSTSPKPPTSYICQRLMVSQAREHGWSPITPSPVGIVLNQTNIQSAWEYLQSHGPADVIRLAHLFVGQPSQKRSRIDPQMAGCLTITSL